MGKIQPAKSPQSTNEVNRNGVKEKTISNDLGPHGTAKEKPELRNTTKRIIARE